jgi:hypothetical protein
MAKPKHSTDCVPLSAASFRRAYEVFQAALAGTMPAGFVMETEMRDVVTGELRAIPDTPFNRAWIASGKCFDDEAERVAFYWRVMKVLPIAASPKYKEYMRKVVLHPALLRAIATVAGGFATPRPQLVEAFDLEFNRQLALEKARREKLH